YTLSSSPSTVGTRYNDRFLYLKWKVLHQIHMIITNDALILFAILAKIKNNGP
ncbi:24003_t:CDS:2, partial [Entrophospora sp. SA101]